MAGLTAAAGTAAAATCGSTGPAALEAGRLFLDGAQVDGCRHGTAFALSDRREARGGWVKEIVRWVDRGSEDLCLCLYSGQVKCEVCTEESAGTEEDWLRSVAISWYHLHMDMYIHVYMIQ